MQNFAVGELVKILQTAVGPAILISGIGLLLLTMTNRLVHVSDRARTLRADQNNAKGEHRDRVRQQISVLWRRAHYLRMAIILAAGSALFSSALIIVLFVGTIVMADVSRLIVGLFIISMGCFFSSIVMLIYDVNQALAALQLELDDWLLPE